MRSKTELPRLNTQARTWLATERRWPSSDAEVWVKHFLEQACRTPDTLAIVLIGSLARATHEPSDVDLLYVYDGAPVALSNHPIDVDIRAYIQHEFVSHLSNRHDVITWAMRFGRVICERDMFWSHLVSSFRGELPLPAPEIIEARIQRATNVYDRLVEIGDREAALEQRVSLLTHRAWAKLLRKHVHPASRPELPEQLRSAGETSLAAELTAALRERSAAKREHLGGERARIRRAG